MLSNTIAITIDATAHTLTRIREDAGNSTYRKIASGLEIELAIRHSREGKQVNGLQMERHNVDLIYTTFAVDGVPTVKQVYTVIRTPRGADIATAVSMALGLNTALAASSAALLTSIVSGES